MRVHLTANLHRPDAIEAARRMAAMLREKGIDVFADPESAAASGLHEVSLDKFASADLVVSFGGDGTLLKAAHLCCQKGTPILGVYYGRFGFVTQAHPNEVGASLSQFFDGKARIEERMMLRTQIFRDGRPIATLHALNDAVLQRAATTRMLFFEIEVDGQFVTKYPADGIVASTPTGSTAYGLSAGGPIVDPKVGAIILTAIAPHTLSYRPLLFAPDSVLSLQIETRGDAVLSCDGSHRIHMMSGDKVEVTRSPLITRLVCVDDRDFLTKLSERILWNSEGGQEDSDQ